MAKKKISPSQPGSTPPAFKAGGARQLRTPTCTARPTLDDLCNRFNTPETVMTRHVVREWDGHDFVIVSESCDDQATLSAHLRHYDRMCRD